MYQQTYKTKKGILHLYAQSSRDARNWSNWIVVLGGIFCFKNKKNEFQKRAMA
jgi:Tat protein secretion system quality control protein TatD with DNase activity